MTKVYSYVIVRDYGFAPNPYSGFCTLATCKPGIRRGASVGDWVAGFGAAKNDRVGKLVFAMRVDEIITFEQYWEDARFQVKKPVLNGSLKRVYGDNIYSRSDRGWIQSDSHHSFSGGRQNIDNLRRDTKANRVLISSNFYYFGRNAVEVPAIARFSGRYDICRPGRGHMFNYPEQLSSSFLHWLTSEMIPGINGEPADWRGVHG